jgi:hypothetical protein
MASEPSVSYFWSRTSASRERIKMPIRNASRADIPLMARVFAAAFAPDHLFNIKFPYREKHPRDYEQALEEHLWLSWYDCQTILQVSYLEKSQSLAQRLAEGSNVGSTPHTLSISSRDDVVITGFAEWKREGPGWESVHGIWGCWDPRTKPLPMQ